MNVQADEQKKMQYGRRMICILDACSMDGFQGRKLRPRHPHADQLTKDINSRWSIYIYIYNMIIYLNYIYMYWRAYVDILCIYMHTQTHIYITSWFVMICNCDASRANGNANAFSLPFLASIALNASGCMRSRGGWWTFARGSVFIILMRDSCTVYLYHLVPFVSSSLFLLNLSHHSRNYICFNGHPLVAEDSGHQEIPWNPNRTTATVLGDVLLALPRHALSETSGVMARLQVVQYQRVVEARVPQAATMGSC